MPRSTGVTVSAVLVIIGSVFTLFGGAMMLLASAFVPKSGAAGNVSVNLGPIIVVEAVIFFGFGVWGLASGIGLLYLKQWARISLLVFAGFLVCLSLPTMVFMAFIPLPDTHDPSLPSNFMSMMRVGMALFYGTFAALGGFWLYFFNKRSVKAQFQTAQPIPETAAGDSFLGTPVPAPGAIQHARPLSITIIGWFLLVSSALAPLAILANSAMLRGVQFPLYFLGVFFFGRSAYLIFAPWMAAQLVAAAGLLKLKRWGLFATIGLQSLAILNGTLLISIPGHRARFQQIMEVAIASMNAHMPQPAPQFNFPVWVGFVMSFPVVLLILWFLITRRSAFSSATEAVDRQHS